jgi:hypothetical protein
MALPMRINHIFIAFMVVVGAAVGIALVIAPDLRNFRISPYFWVLIAMAIFELLAFARGRGAPGAVVAMEARLLGDRADSRDPDHAGSSAKLL